ncbi:transporter substrate-binding domain-containing protein [Chitinimonas sp. BJB300]|uniref:transporter substrate-binding domain-containing protein n=1 Tax=Chitinimonas sp. BJB300 TaxID=1559339 RepID=UPI001304682B|nr:transporter substrate-binding domain-containing protein [Chitinimonas sp. BJB300]
MKFRLALVAIVCLIASTARADDLDKIQKKGEIIIGVRAEAPPFGFLDKTKNVVTGYDVEFGKYIAKKLGVKPIFLTLSPTERIPALQDNRVDLIIAAMAKNAKSEKILEFSLGYFVAIQKFAAKPGRFKSLSQFNGAKVCFAQGTTTEHWLEENLPKTVRIPAVGYQEAFSLLQTGGCEAVAGAGTILKGNLSKLPKTDVVVTDDIPLGIEIFAMGMRKGEKRLKQMVNDALLESEKTGEAVRIYEHYFGENTAVPQLRLFKIQG